MTSFDFSRYGLCICVAAAMLGGCGGSQAPIGSWSALHATSQSQTFSFTGSEQTFNVPTNVTQITVTASGASGGYASCGKCPAPGNGDLITATIPVTPNETLDVFVGGNGFNENGYNGGGAVTGSYGYYNLDGGGASDVRQRGDSLKDRVVVAGGGGSTGQVGPLYAGGKGGSGGRGGTPSRGGAGGDDGTGGGCGGGPGCTGQRGKRGVAAQAVAKGLARQAAAVAATTVVAAGARAAHIATAVIAREAT